MDFQFKPRIYSLLLCAAAHEDEATGRWLIQPFSEIAAPRLPADVAVTVFAQIMGPPGRYALDLRLYQAADPEGSLQTLPTRAFTLHEGKNLDFVLQLRMHLTQHGLYILEASIPDHHAVQAPLRVSRGG